jgi:hypothetical protein
MVCSQFQGLVIMKALALTKIDLYKNMLEQQEEGQIRIIGDRASAAKHLMQQDPSLFDLHILSTKTRLSNSKENSQHISQAY